MIIDAVLVFGLLSALFEAFVLMKLPPRIRCRVLGSSFGVAAVHAIIMIFNLIIHFGTITGTMSAIVSGIASFIVVPIIRRYSGIVRSGIYHKGWAQYPIQKIR